jgi:hypothetical protein
MRTPGAKAPQWGTVKGGLKNVRTNTPEDAEVVRRLIDMVKKLDDAAAAAPPGWLPSLRVVFHEFFFKLDGNLLDATDRVINTADVLNFRLRGYLR